MAEIRLNDIPKIQDTMEKGHQLPAIKCDFSDLRPVLASMDVDTASLENIAGEDDGNELEQIADEISTIPDRFHDLFAGRGWIVYGEMNLEMTRRAVAKAENKGIKCGEKILLSHYDAPTIRLGLQQLERIDAFQPRMSLAQKALSDYEAGRYHACVPVVFALMDGLLQDIYVKVYRPKRSWSTAKAQLEAWDSLAGYSKGLNRLQELHLKSRYKTHTEQIEVPYRNGIMHGMDLGYDSKAVAVKTWIALFALGEWAEKAEQGKIENRYESESALLEFSDQ